ncbi:MgtC/SapB family protein, partial [Citrobacter sp. R1]|uniref:MgtC/SapB family protein n=2 Tax=Citrobacter TaxID=544 RepID=UPI00227BFDEC
VKTGNNARNGGKNSLNRLIRCVCGKKIGPDPRNFNQRVSLGRNDLLIRTFPISGLTTAAIVWASAGVGITCGAGFYFHAFFATALFLLAIKLSPFIIFLQTRNQFPGKVKVRVILDQRDALENLITRIHQQKNIIENITIRDIKKGKIEVNLKIVIRKKMTLPDLYHDLTHVEHVCAIALEH